MKWQCALLQRWLPEYPDGDLPAFWKARLKSHLEHCPACRQELAALEEVVKAIKAVPVADPGPEFWTEFSRELHLKLAQAAHTAPEALAAPKPWYGRLPYLLGVPALAALVLWTAVHFSNQERPGLTPQPQMTQQAVPEKDAATARAPEPARAKMARVPLEEAPVGARSEQFAHASLEPNRTMPEDEADLSSWDLDAELSGMTDEDKEAFLQKLHQHQKDGSWLVRFSAVFYA